MYDYAIELTPDDNDTVMATAPDIPEVMTFGEDEADALARAADAIETALIGYIADRRDLPTASPARGRPVATLSLLARLKLAIYQAMRERNWRKIDLARALGDNPRQVDRLLDLRHASKVDQLERALAVCGQRADLTTRAALAA